jgi:hypothetical protein
VKYTLLLLLSFISITSTFADSGGEEYNYYKIINNNCYSPTSNLQYIGVIDTVAVAGYKGKLQDRYITSNIAVYDITKNQINYIFNTPVKQTIIGFSFESSFNEKFKTIEFNNIEITTDYQNGLNYAFSNNFNITNRPLSNNLIVITEDFEHKNKTIWICDKYGNNLRKAFEFTNDWSWDIDVRNQTIRLSRQINSKIEIKNEKY